MIGLWGWRRYKDGKPEGVCLVVVAVDQNLVEVGSRLMSGNTKQAAQWLCGTGRFGKSRRARVRLLATQKVESRLITSPLCREFGIGDELEMVFSTSRSPCVFGLSYLAFEALAPLPRSYGWIASTVLSSPRLGSASLQML